MRITKPGVLALILMTSACASNPGDRGSQKEAKEPLRGGVAEFELTSYDGERINGRVLLGATIDSLVINGHIDESYDVELENFRACDKKGPVPSIIACSVGDPDRPDQVVTIRPGYWYGRNVMFWPF